MAGHSHCLAATNGYVSVTRARAYAEAVIPEHGEQVVQTHALRVALQVRERLPHHSRWIVS